MRSGKTAAAPPLFLPLRSVGADSAQSIRKGALEHFQPAWLPVKRFGNATKQKVGSVQAIQLSPEPIQVARACAGEAR